MRKFLWVVLTALFATIGTHDVRADSISETLSFTGVGTLPTSGSFTYDTTTNQFESFTVVWDNWTFDLSTGANHFDGNSSIPSVCIGPTAAATFFNLITDTAGCGSTLNWSTDLIGVPVGPELDATFFINVVPYYSSPVIATTCSNAPQCPLQTNSIVANGSGDFSVTEPATMSLTLLGVGLLGLMSVMRKRSARGRQDHSSFLTSDNRIL